MAKATHSGHCQACGHLQKLPSGRLAKHGYTVAHGYFSGTCQGSGHLPFEISFGLVLDFIEGAKRGLAAVEANQRELRKEATAETLMWATISYPNPKGKYYPKVTVWEQVALRASFEPYEHDPTSGSIQYRYTDRIGVEHGHYTSGFYGVQRHEAKGKTDEELRRMTVQKYNERRASWLESEAVSLRRYIVWQEERVRGWKEMPLLPVSAKKDKTGFQPTAANY